MRDGPITIRVDPVPDQVHRATAHAQHPLDRDVTITRAVTGTTPAGAVELARLELHGLATRIYLDPRHAERQVDTVRGRHVFVHGDHASVRRVQACCRHRHALDTTELQIGHAYLRLSGGLGLLVDDVVAQLAVELVGGQAALPV